MKILAKYFTIDTNISSNGSLYNKYKDVFIDKEEREYGLNYFNYGILLASEKYIYFSIYDLVDRFIILYRRYEYKNDNSKIFTEIFNIQCEFKNITIFTDDILIQEFLKYYPSAVILLTNLRAMDICISIDYIPKIFDFKFRIQNLRLSIRNYLLKKQFKNVNLNGIIQYIKDENFYDSDVEIVLTLSILLYLTNGKLLEYINTEKFKLASQFTKKYKKKK